MLLPKTILGNYIQGKLIRNSTSIAANYHAACIVQSKSDYVLKLSIVIKQLDECSYRLEDFNILA